MISYPKKNLIKKLTAAIIAVSLSFGILSSAGIPDPTPPVISSADKSDPNAEYDRKLAELDSQKKALDEKIAKAGNDIKGKQEKLDAVNQKAEIIKKKIKKMEKRTSKLEEEMCDLDDKMRETQHDLDVTTQNVVDGIGDFKSRLRAMYVAGTDTYSEVLINASSFYDVLMRIELIKRVAKHDNDTIDYLLEEKAKIEAYQSELNTQSEELKKKSADYAEKQSDLAKQQTELLDMQKEYGNSIDALKGDLDEYIGSANLISNEYARVSEEARTTTVTTTTTTTTTRKTHSAKKTDDEPDEPDKPNDTTRRTHSPSRTVTTTRKPVETTTKPTTTKPPQTTTPAPEPEPEPAPDNGDRQSKINTVVEYAKGMVGGSYVWAGEQYRATDCSGLVLLSYRQIGISLPHYAASQANYGENVSRNDLQPGDLVFFGGSSYSSIYHVAMYIGDGKIVHAESTATGIVISYLDSVARYNNITCMKRLI